MLQPNQISLGGIFCGSLQWLSLFLKFSLSVTPNKFVISDVSGSWVCGISAILTALVWPSGTVLCGQPGSGTCTYSNDPHLMHLVKVLVFLASSFDFWFTAIHIPGSNNTFTDALSRNNILFFKSQVPHAHPENLSLW